MSEIPFVGDLDGANAYIATLEKERDTEKDRAEILLKKLELARASRDMVRNDVGRLRGAIAQHVADAPCCEVPLLYIPGCDLCITCENKGLCMIHKESKG